MGYSQIEDFIMKRITDLKKKLIYTFLYLFAVFALYLLGAKCIFQSLFGIPCPGCKMTRAVISVLKLDFKAAANYNFMVFFMPLLYLYFLCDGKLFKNRTLNNFVLIIILLGFLANWITKLVFLH